MAVARRHNICAGRRSANGGEYRGRKLGSIGDAGIFSFQHQSDHQCEGGNHQRREVFRRLAASMIQRWPSGKPNRHGNLPRENARMCELRAAVGYVQFKRMAGILAQTRKIGRRS